ncbi:myelin transcription factor 1-like [Centruroides sculpturatus]|uniref:myelin transcription factor 1-like n=1 Tax=Centruroides sculpturatus TaxID=218467 RepID=UPI000C6E132C|nr:myelin transcription factor 1-like [Centruroides sculpturatus]
MYARDARSLMSGVSNDIFLTFVLRSAIFRFVPIRGFPVVSVFLYLFSFAALRHLMFAREWPVDPLTFVVRCFSAYEREYVEVLCDQLREACQTIAELQTRLRTYEANVPKNVQSRTDERSQVETIVLDDDNEEETAVVEEEEVETEEVEEDEDEEEQEEDEEL